MGTLDHAFRRDNLERAWRWVRSNPNPAYKSYFRSLYSNYAVADAALLDDLCERLTHGAYVPAHSCKLFFPKPSGVLRPYTLLTVEDQIVYQAMVNVVAEKLYPKARHRYLVEVFSHLYAGKSSPWFYRRWQVGYGRFIRAAREAVADGLRYAARFDLTAFYDSLDHGVLTHFLQRLGCDRDFCDTLTAWLSRRTATKDRIYHRHGIPQGPLPSGLLAEVVLQQFDATHKAPKGVRYLRYVDDIRLFACSEKALRRAVTALDVLSKGVGLFPQSAKINIHKVADVEEELRSLSRPDEDLFEEDGEQIDQAEVRRRLTALSPRGKVADASEFKYLLGVARPSSRLNDRLWRVMDAQPELHGPVLRYFQRYRTLPRRAADRLVRTLREQPIYAAVIAELIRTAEGRINHPHAAEVDRHVKANWKPRILPSADLLAALGRWGMARGLLLYSQVEYAVCHLREWWARADLVAVLDDRIIGEPSFKALLFQKLRDPVSDVAIAAAVHLAQRGVAVTVPNAAIQQAAAHVLEAFGLLPGGAPKVCGIRTNFDRLLGGKGPAIDWPAVFGRHYRRVERHAVWCRALAETNVTAFVNAMEVFNDWLLGALYKHDPSLGTYNTGSVGSVLGSTRLQANYPAVHALVVSVHEKRSESALSHAWKTVGGRRVKPTGFVKYAYLRTAKKLIAAALTELAAKW